MNFLISANTDIGLKKSTNQDSLIIQHIKAGPENMVFAMLCDGMGGLKKGEVASAACVYWFKQWLQTELPGLCKKGITADAIQSSWNELILGINEKILNYGKQHDVNMGTTAVVLLVTEKQYFIMNIGDSRIYEIRDDVYQLTKDQTLVEQEVDKGMITPDQAKCDSRRNILLQCIGALKNVSPDFYCGETKQDTVFMLCSDGFRHEISREEFYQVLNPQVLNNREVMRENGNYLIELNKQRQEMDNITVALIRTY